MFYVFHYFGRTKNIGFYHSTELARCLKQQQSLAYFHFGLQHSSYIASPLTVNRYFCRGWRGEFG